MSKENTSRQDLLHIAITGRGDGSLKESMALRLRKQTFAEPLEALRKNRRAKDYEERVRAAEALYEADIANHGVFHMKVWSRDCDMVECTHLSSYESIEEYHQSQEDAGEDAEGPITWTYISHGDALDFESSTRDRIMENYEDGGDGYHLGI